MSTNWGNAISGAGVAALDLLSTPADLCWRFEENRQLVERQTNAAANPGRRTALAKNLVYVACRRKAKPALFSVLYEWSEWRIRNCAQEQIMYGHRSPRTITVTAAPESRWCRSDPPPDCRRTPDPRRCTRFPGRPP